MILILGYGNPLRSDDGAGVRLAEKLAEEKWENVEVMTAQQISLDMLEDMVRREKIILIDAASDGPRVSIQNIKPGKRGLVMSHHTDPGALAGLAEKIYGRRLDMTVCRLRGENFEVGTELSAPVARRVAVAYGRIKKILAREIAHA